MQSRIHSLEERNFIYKDFNAYTDQVPAFEETTRGEQIYVAVMDDKIAGMASVWEPDNFIHYLFVDSSYRNRGVGKVMVTKLVKLSGSPLTLKCLLENEKGMAFYHATGWKEVEKVCVRMASMRC